MHYVQPAIKLVAELRLRFHGNHPMRPNRYHHCVLCLIGQWCPNFGTDSREQHSTCIADFMQNQEPGGENPVQDERRVGHGVTDRGPVLEGTYTSYNDPSQRALYPSHALRIVDSIKLNEVHVPVQISALSKMLQKPLDGQVAVTDVQLEQLQQGDIDRDRSFEDPHPRSWMYNPMLRGSARNNRTDYSTEALTKGSYITTNSVQSNLDVHSSRLVSGKAMHHTKGFRPSLAHASEESRTSHMELSLIHI